MTQQTLERPARRGPSADNERQARGAPDASKPDTVTKSPRRPRIRQSRQLANLAFFARQLYVLISCGTPLIQGIRALERQTKDTLWRDILCDVGDRVEEGSSLADAMEANRDCFDSVCRALVAAGESSGSLDGMLDRIAHLTRHRMQLRRSIIGALIYPVLLLGVAAGALVLIMTVVLPRFEEMFSTLDAPLPPMTQALMAAGDLLRSYWWGALGGLVASVFVVRLAARSVWGKRAIDTAVLRMPTFGKIVSSFSTARIVRLLGVLIESHLPLLEALQLTRGAVDNVHYRELLTRAEEDVQQGIPLNAAFTDTWLVSPSVQEAIKSGEQTGQLGPLLLNIADFLDSDNETVVKSLTSILEPLLLVVLGGVIGFVAISLFLPLFDLTATT